MPFVKGKSGNPGGRAPRATTDGRTLTQIARDHTDTAILALVEIVGNGRESAAARVSAANSLLDRGWGKAKQPIVGGDEEDGDNPIAFGLNVKGLSNEQLRALASIPVQAD